MKPSHAMEKKFGNAQDSSPANMDSQFLHVYKIFSVPLW